MVLVAAIVLAASLSACDDSGRCQELKAWYRDNPGDSNPSIARDYQEACNKTPPPVLSGELDENFNYN